MKTRISIILLAICLIIPACGGLEPTVPPTQEENGNGNGAGTPTETEPPVALETTMTIPPVEFETGTKSVMDVSDSGLTFRWAEGDKVAVFSSSTGMAVFNLTSGANQSRGVFDGEGFDLTPGSTYYGFYPLEAASAEKTAVPLSFAGQVAAGDDDKTHIVQKDYLKTSAVANENGKATFDFEHLGAFLRTKIKMPAGAAIDKVEFIPMYNQIPTGMAVNLTTGALSRTDSSVVMPVTVTSGTPTSGDTFTLWASMPNKNYARDIDDFAVVVHSGDDVYSARHSGAAFNAGKAYSWNLTPLLDADPGYGFNSVSVNNQVNVSGSVNRGDHSGITWLGNNRYAVVDDKLNGGGIVFYEIDIDQNTGIVNSVSFEVAAGTSESTVTKRDNEGIAFVPENNGGTLFVSAEGNQSIQEYDLTGRPTGRSMSIPVDLAKNKISSNKGFEALTYNSTTDLFWTVTEGPLPKDASLGRILRLQSFTSDLQPGERFLYRLDAPATTGEMADDAVYAFGVPALAAMDDGRILVMERETYGSTSTFTAYSYIKIYAVKPIGNDADNAGILRKTKVAEFSTGGNNIFSMLSVANYEGMCIGPTLSDGSTCLVLIPDTQNKNGVTEYVKTITIK